MVKRSVAQKRVAKKRVGEKPVSKDKDSARPPSLDALPGEILVMIMKLVSLRSFFEILTIHSRPNQCFH